MQGCSSWGAVAVKQQAIKALSQRTFTCTCTSHVPTRPMLATDMSGSPSRPTYHAFCPACLPGTGLRFLQFPCPGVLYAGSLWLSNTSYLYLSVSFIQMTKSLMPGLVYACGCFVGTEVFKPAVALNMALIAAGVVVCALGEVNLVLLGLLEQLTALGFEVGETGQRGWVQQQHMRTGRWVRQQQQQWHVGTGAVAAADCARY